MNTTIETQAAPTLLVLTKPTKSVLSYCAGSDTIRQFPENYCIASKNGNKWQLNADLASNPYLVAKVSIELLKFENAYCNSGLELLGNLTN